jgi:hypothetical protein
MDSTFYLRKRRADGHRFCFRQRMAIAAFHFALEQ